jgi:hypothetical protein
MGGGAMQAIAKLHGPNKPFPIGGGLGDPKVIARPSLAVRRDFFRSPKPDLGECSQRRLHFKPPQGVVRVSPTHYPQGS